MIKRILRAGLGVIFFFVFFVFLLVGALKFRLLSPSFWKTALDKGGVYLVLQDKMGELRTQMETSIRKEAGGQAIPKGITDLLLIPEQLGSDRLRELVETNLDRLLGYLEGKDKDLTLFLPVKEWKLPVAGLGMPALSQLTGQTTPEQAMAAAGLGQEQVTTMTKGLTQIKMIVGYLTVVWLGLLLVVVLMLVGHYFLGVGLADRISGTAWLLMISGLVAKLIGIGAGNIFELIAVNSKPPMEPWIADLGRSLVGQFFNLGATIGLVVGIVGLGVIVAVIYLSKTGKIKKEEKEKMSLKKRILALNLGIVLGFVVMATIVFATVLALGGNVDFKVGGGSVSVGSQTKSGSGASESTTEEQQKLASDVYKSDMGWQIQFPAGWEVVKGEKSEGVIKKPVTSPTDWAAIEVSPLVRDETFDSGNYLKLAREAFAAGKSGLENGTLVEAYEERQETTGSRRLVIIVEADGVVSGIKMRQRIYRFEIYPAKSYDGFMIMVKLPVESLAKYEQIIMQAVDTFKIL